MSKIGKIWDRLERPAIYTVIFIFIIAELLAYVFPPIAKLLEDRGGLILISLILVAIFRYIDQRLSQPLEGLILAKSFGDAVASVVKGQKVIDQLDLFAHSSSKYYQFIRDSGCKIKKMRLLISGQLISGALPYPQNFRDKSSVKAQSEVARENWLRLQSEGMIENLEIKYYEFWPSFHFMIVDNERAQWGMFEPIPNGAGVKVQRNYSTTHGPDSRVFIENLQSFFTSTLSLSKSHDSIIARSTVNGQDGDNIEGSKP